MQLIESRRITGRHLLTDEPGAAAELLFEAGEDGNDALDLIGDRALGLAEALGWPRPRFTVRRGSKGASVALTAQTLFSLYLLAGSAFDSTLYIADTLRLALASVAIIGGIALVLRDKSPATDR
jgi:hypothetical protein